MPGNWKAAALLLVRGAMSFHHYALNSRMLQLDCPCNTCTISIKASAKSLLQNLNKVYST